MFFYIIIAILSGITIVLSRIVNAKLSEKIGLFESTFYNFFTGFIFSIIILFFAKENFNFSLLTNKSIPFYAYIGGVIGVFSITLSNYAAPKTSVFYMTLFIFIGQILTGMIIDYFALKELSLGKVIGSILVALGLTFNLLIDKKDKIDSSKQ